MSASSAQTQVLTNGDLLPNIFAFLDPEAFHKGTWALESATRSNLLSVALTCRVFFEPASSLLWRMLESFLPALKLISTFVRVNDVYTINDTISSEDRQRLQLYGSKVRYLYLPSFREIIKGHAIHRLASLESPIFPNLQKIHIPTGDFHTVRSSDALDVLFLAYSPSLTTLYFTGITPTTEENTASYLTVLGRKGIPLQDIVLSGRVTSHTVAPLSSFSRLKSLNVKLTTLMSSDFRSWSRLLSLTHLIINMDQLLTGSSDSTVAPQGTIRVPFQQLQDLRLIGPSVEILKLLRIMDISENLATIRLTFPNSTNLTPSVTSCISECARSFPVTSVFIVQVSFGNAEVLPESILSSLHSFKHLRFMDISGISLALNDNTIRGLCGNDNWKNLQTLRLPPAPDNNCPSLLSLGMIASGLPRIVELQMHINFQLQTCEALNNERATIPRVLHASGLQRLSITHIRPPSDPITRNTNDTFTVEMMIGISRYIEHHFSQSIKISAPPSRYAFSDEQSAWVKGVIALIKEYRVVREETLSEASESTTAVVISS